jgi:hypothetical protein
LPDREPQPAGLVTRSGPSITDCLEAAMRADPSLTIEEAIRTVPVSQATIDRYAAAEAAGLEDVTPDG